MNSFIWGVFRWGRESGRTSKLWFYSPNIANVFVFVIVSLEVYWGWRCKIGRDKAKGQQEKPPTASGNGHRRGMINTCISCSSLDAGDISVFNVFFNMVYFLKNQTKTKFAAKNALCISLMIYLFFFFRGHLSFVYRWETTMPFSTSNYPVIFSKWRIQTIIWKKNIPTVPLWVNL